MDTLQYLDGLKQQRPQLLLSAEEAVQLLEQYGYQRSAKQPKPDVFDQWVKESQDGLLGAQIPLRTDFVDYARRMHEVMQLIAEEAGLKRDELLRAAVLGLVR